MSTDEILKEIERLPNTPTNVFGGKNVTRN